MPTTLGALSIAAVAAALFLWLLQRRAGNWAFLLLAVAPFLFLYGWSEHNRVSSAHGLWHASIVYQIMSGGVPPNNPLLGGEPLYYGWAHHAVVAGLSTLLRLSPSHVFVLLNLVLLGLTLFLAYRASRALCADRVVNLFAVFLSVYGLTFLARGPVADVLEALIPMGKLHPGLPIALKFGQVNSTPLGVVFFALYLLAMLRVFSRAFPAVRHYVLLALAAAGAALFYPYFWLALLCCCAASCAAIVAESGFREWRRPVLAAACTLAGSLVALPYLAQVINLGAETRSLAFASFGHAVVYGYTFLLVVLPVAALAFWKRRALRSLLGSRRDQALVLIASCLTPAAMFALLEGPLGTEYKFAMASFFTLGVMTSVCMKELFYDDRRVCLAVAVAFLLPFGAFAMRKIETRDYQPTPIVEGGVYLEHVDPDRRALHQWIRSETPRNAIFVDRNFATLALFAHRQTYYGQVSESGRRRGWYVPFWMLGYAKSDTKARRAIVTEIYETPTPLDPDVVAALEATLDDEPVYLVSRDAATRERLSGQRRLGRVFERGEITVYEVTGRAAPSDD